MEVTWTMVLLWTMVLMDHGSLVDHGSHVDHGSLVENTSCAEHQLCLLGACAASGMRRDTSDSNFWSSARTIGAAALTHASVLKFKILTFFTFYANSVYVNILLSFFYTSLLCK